MKNKWQQKPLGKVCQIKPPKAEARCRLSHTDLVSFVPMENLGINQKNFTSTQTRPLSEVSGSYTYFAENDVLLAKITPCFENGKLGIATNLINGIGFGSSEFIVFRPGPCINTEWLYYFLSSDEFRQEGAERMSGAVGHKRVSKEFIEEYEIPIPPLIEQKRIVSILDEAFEGIATAKANVEKNLQNAREIFESHLNAVFTQSGAGWIDRKLGDLAKINYGYTESACHEPVGPKFLRITDIQNNHVAWDTVPYCPIASSDVSKYQLAEGDIVFARTGATTGKSYLITEPPYAVFASYLIRVQLNAREILSSFLSLFFQTKSYWKNIKLGSAGSAQGGFNATKLSKLVISYPKLVKEQQIIVEKLHELTTETRRLETIYRQKLAALDALKKSLLAQAFAGNL